MQLQLQTRSGESQRRLQDGHGHAEKLFLEQVWWPAVGRFDFLHAEYPISDFKDGDRYLDFAYIRGTHVKNVCVRIYTSYKFSYLIKKGASAPLCYSCSSICIHCS